MSNALIRLNQEEKICKSLQLYPPKLPINDNNNIGNEDNPMLIENAVDNVNPSLNKLTQKMMNINKDAESAI